MNGQANQDTTEITYFIDESGNTGDLILGGETLSYGGQPYFGLGCLGITDLTQFEADITALKLKHRIQANDLKSTKIYKNKPGFILDLIKLIASNKIPFFIELVEKKFFAATNLAFYLVWPPYFSGPGSKQADYIRTVFAQILTKEAPNQVFSMYFKACQSQSKDDLLRAFDCILEFARTGTSPQHAAMAESVVETMDDFQVMLTQESSEEKAVRRFLPMPDQGKKGKDVWILPNYSSLTNMYARINHAHDGHIKRVKLVHDVQTQFDDILFSAKKAAEEASPEREVSPVANYQFLQQAELSIARSEDSVGVQAADILTGFIVRYAQDRLVYKVEPAPELTTAFHLMAEAENELKGYGVNYVWCHNVLDVPA
ncbi:DUF3800 domain-containing protein [Pseudomonas bijieensis]|uniref:DUF3800 domain-containing protein n=1 Tax=Pseudomonas bijieensis TaxID=2681983 RepID=A0A6N1C9F7_9PSED|nr:DUF3800 domain-containing protein [Pseudomonas bijieensis]QKS80946.1 DUF3800 domain-containing protein [Pseudomonas bijieensis]